MARYTLILGTKNWSSWSLRPYMAMRATGAAFAEVVIALRRPDTVETIKAHSSAGRVPILMIEEGGDTTTVWDSLAICETLAERHPEARLWPADPAARAEARSYAAEMHAGFGPLRVALSMDFARRLPMPAMNDAAKADIARVIAAWMHALSHHGDEEGFLFGRFSIADAMYAPVVSRFVTYGIDLPPLVRAYVERVFALPAMVAWGKAAAGEVADGLPEGPLVAARR